MTTPDNQPGIGNEIERIINEAKDSINKEVEEAEKATNSSLAKRILAEKLREELERVKISAEEVVKEEEEINRGKRLVRTKLGEGEKNLKVLTRVVEAAKKGVSVGKTAESQALLVNLAERDLTPSTASAIEYYLTDYLIGNKNIVVGPPGDVKSEFEISFENLAKSNPIAAKEILRALEKAVETGEIVSIEKDKIEKLKNYLIFLEKNSHREPEKIPTKEEMEKFIKLWEKVNERIAERTRDKRLTGDEAEYNKLLFSRQETDVLKLFRELGLTEAEAHEFSTLRPAYYGELNTKFMEQYCPLLAPKLREAQKEFDVFFYQLLKRNEKGEIIMEKTDRQRLKNMVRKYLYYGLQPIHEHRSEDFHSALRERSDVGHYLSLIHQIIAYNCERIADLVPRKDGDLREFLTDVGGTFINRSLTFAQIFHNLPLYVRDIGSLENLSKMFAYIYPSQLTELFDDEPEFMMLARDELTMLIREYLVKKDNIYDGTFLSGKYKEEGCYWSEGFRRDFINRLEHKLERLGMSLDKEDEWKIAMFSTYAEGIGIATLTDAEILITSRPVSHFADVHPLMQLLSAKHNWLGGRGERDPGHLINRFLLGMEVELLPHERSLLARLITKREHIPDKLVSLTNRRINEYGGKVIKGMVEAVSGDFLFDMGGLYQELISMLSMPGSLDSWHGWRVRGVTGELNNIFSIIFGEKTPTGWKGKELDDAWKSWNDDDWRNFFDLSLELYGTSSLWWQIGIGGTGNRVTHEIKRLFLDLCGGDINKAEKMYNELSGDKALAQVINFEIDDPKYKGRKVSFLELRSHKMNQLRGEIFFRFLRRNPGEFLSLLSQLVPEILDDKTKVFLSESEIKDLMKRENKTKTEIDRVLGLRESLKRRWGEDLFNLFANIHSWLGETMKNFNNPTTGKAFSSRKDFYSYFLERASDATERLKMKNEPLRREIIKIATNPGLDNTEKQRRINEIRKKMLYLRKEDFADDTGLWEAFAGEKGFFKLLTGVSYGDADSFYNKLGSYNKACPTGNLFFKMAEVWYLRNGDTNPFSSDMAYYDIFKHIPSAGENVLKRLIDADWTIYKEVVTKVPQLEKILLKAANTGDLKEIYDLHQKIFDTLSGLVGVEYAYKANYILAQIVIQFFMDHSVLRDPIYNYLGPISWVMRTLIGKNRSLSRLLTGNIHAFSMDANAIRDYLINLGTYMHVINQKGIYSQEQLEKVFEVTKTEFFLGDIGPKLAWFIIIFILWSYIKKALEEAEGKKK